MADNEIHLYGTVGASFWDEDYFTAKQVRDQLAAMTGDLTVRINSGGGIATEGQAIYTMLKDYPGRVTVVVDGVAASAASLIAMAGDTIRMRLGAWMLVHDPAQWLIDGRGTEADHLKVAEILSVVGDAYAEIYADRSGMTRALAREIMRAETVMDGEKAIELGFADEREEAESQAAASFDYRIYSNAPSNLRAASNRPGGVPGREAVLAMVAGVPGKQRKEPSMAEKSTPAAEAKPAATPVAEQPAAVAAAAASSDVLMTAAQASRLHTIADRAGIPSAEVTKLIDGGSSFDAVLDQITAKWQASPAAGDDLPRAGRETAKITRDERETLRAGMTSALVAQLGRKDPDHEAGRQYMQSSILDMAVACTGYRGPTRTAADRLDAITMAFHTTSDFPAIFESALNKRLLDRYADAPVVYPQISRRRDFTDFRPHPMTRAGDFPLLREVNEAGEIQFGTFGESKETAVLKAYAIALAVTRQMMINDDLGAIEDVIRDAGMAVARTEEAVFFAMMLSGANADGPTLASTTRQVFNITDGSKAGTAAAITTAAVGLGRAAIRKHKSVDNSDLGLAPAILLTGPDKELEADQLTVAITANETVKVNPFSGRLTPISTPKITGNAWYLLPSPDVQSLFVHGFLQGDQGPRVRMEEPFGTQGIRYSIERDFGVAAVDYRGGYKNAGA
ncbi:MAG: ATP-dependent Clp protease proteolytic subunit [Rhodobacteraceae bacterium]|jgi:ATP-dependent protease ClpP protease subunit|nr:ATP-dependent Clp protease proteolytic subunit [Paracoccaceae bacterium]